MIDKTKNTYELTLDGEVVAFSHGESLFEISERHKKEVPTLCYDKRLDAFGGCRMCMVEVEGFRNPVASCTTKASPGMVVHTHTAKLEKDRKTLLELVVSENRQVETPELSGFASQELTQLANRYDAITGRFAGAKSGTSRTEDLNPFILRDYDQCISCYRCVRVCAEREGDYAINVMNRGFATQITTEFNSDLRESECTFCGQCVQTCPTGALADKKALRDRKTVGDIKKTRTICTYCGVGCSVDIMSKEDKIVGIQPAMDGPANLGALCVKGQFAYDFVQHDDRLTTPLVRKNGKLEPVSWTEAIDVAAKGFEKVSRDHGNEAIYAIASGRAPHEASYALQKLMRAGWGLNQIDNCSRA